MAVSSNLVRVALIEETTYGETPMVGNFKTARFTSESLSGTPDTVESQQIRVDRMSSGQIVTGLTVEGGLAFELAKEEALDLLLESAMYNEWDVKAPVTVGLEYAAMTKQLIRATGSWITDMVVVGDFLTLSGFTNVANNTQVMVTEVIDALTIKIESPKMPAMVSEVSIATSYKRLDKLTIGTMKKSFSVEKKFTDLTDKGVVYKGMVAGQLDLNIAFGELISGNINLSGNYYEAVDQAADFITFGRTLDPAATTQTFNGSVDMPFLTTNAVGPFSQDGFDIQSITLGLNNNLSAQNQIGRISAKDFTPGTAQIEIGLNAYLSDESWSVLSKKLSQDPFSIGFMVKNSGGFYAFYMPAIQVSFPDPSSGGQNQDVLLEMTGTAKVADDGSSALVIFRS